MSTEAILAAVIFILGFSASHFIDGYTIQKMSNDITAANTLAATTLREKTRDVAAATAIATKSNLNLDASHESTINALNAQRDSFANRGLRDTGSRPSCPGAVPASADASIFNGGADPGQLSAEFAGFLRRETYRADRAAELYAKCRTFALTDNCGVAR